LSKDETAQITGYFRCEMKMVQAISMLKGTGAIRLWRKKWLRPGEDFPDEWPCRIFSALGIRLDADPTAAEPLSARVRVELHASCGSCRVDTCSGWAGRAAGGAQGLASENASMRERAIRIVVWQETWGRSNS